MASNEMEPKKWLRCNNCFSLMCKAKDHFSLTFCGHIFCSKCIRKATKQCPQCKNQDVPAMPLLEPLKPEVKHCFESTDDLSEKLRQATLFQNMQYSLNCRRLNELDKKYALVKVEYYRKSKELKKVMEKVSKLEKRLQELESELESKLKHTEFRKSSVMLTPFSKVSSLAGSIQSLRSLDRARNEGQSFTRPQSFHQSIKLQRLDLNGEFRIPNITKVPRSVGNSSRTSSNSSRGTPFSNYTPLCNRR